MNNVTQGSTGSRLIALVLLLAAPSISCRADPMPDQLIKSMAQCSHRVNAPMGPMVVYISPADIPRQEHLVVTVELSQGESTHLTSRTFEIVGADGTITPVDAQLESIGKSPVLPEMEKQFLETGELRNPLPGHAAVRLQLLPLAGLSQGFALLSPAFIHLGFLHSTPSPVIYKTFADQGLSLCEP